MGSPGLGVHARPRSSFSCHAGWMSRDAVRAHREALVRMDSRRNRAVGLLDAADAQWWRMFRNGRRAREVLGLMADNDLDYLNALAAWGEMSPSERAAENKRTLHGAAIQPPSS